jgi:hypothetical protein
VYIVDYAKMNGRCENSKSQFFTLNKFFFPHKNASIFSSLYIYIMI